MSKLKQKHKDYLIKNEIKDLTDLVTFTEIQRNTKNLNQEDRQMLFDFVWLILHEESELKSFFREKVFKNSETFEQIKQHALDSSTSIEEIVKIVNCDNLDNLKEIINPVSKKQTPFYLDETLSQDEKEKKVIEDWNKDDWFLGKLPKRGKIITYNLDKEEGKKESEGKLHYELSWEFIEEMAKRMANNKSDKYPLYNWKKPMDVQKLKDAINRHHIEVMKGNYKDGDEILGHIVQYACNSMMLWEQLKEK